MTPAAHIERLVALGRSNREIAKLAKCSPQNIDQIRARLREAVPPLCVKLTSEQRQADKDRLRKVLNL